MKGRAGRGFNLQKVPKFKWFWIFHLNFNFLK